MTVVVIGSSRPEPLIEWVSDPFRALRHPSRQAIHLSPLQGHRGRRGRALPAPARAVPSAAGRGGGGGDQLSRNAHREAAAEQAKHSEGARPGSTTCSTCSHIARCPARQWPRLGQLGPR